MTYAIHFILRKKKLKKHSKRKKDKNKKKEKPVNKMFGIGGSIQNVKKGFNPFSLMLSYCWG